VIEAIELTSTCRSRGAGGGPVEKVSFDVYPGQVTALLGAPGAGKSTVLRLMVELEPGGGRTLFGGRPYRALRPAVREVGLALNPDAVHPGRTVQAHLQLYAAGGGVPKPRVAEVLEVAGLSTQATVRCGRLDAGQRQRLAIAAALLGDPAALILDEPHALDSHGMSWFHALIRAYAAQGRTVLVAATDPDTLSGTADHVVVLRRDEHDGLSRVIASRSAAEVFDERRATVVQVRSPQAARLAAALESEGAHLAPAGPGALQVRGLDRARIGEVAHIAGVCLHELSEIGHDDDVFGLHPVPRQKELLPGLNRTGTWHSGVRVVADGTVEEVAGEIAEEIEEAELVEAAAEASAEAERPETATDAEVRAARDAAAGEVTVSAPVQTTTAMAAGAHTPEVSSAAQAAGPNAGVQAAEPTVGAQAAEPNVAAQAPEQGFAAQVQANAGAPAAEPSVEVQAWQASVGAQASEPSVAVQASQPTVGSQASEPSQPDSASDAQSSQEQSPQESTAEKSDQQPADNKPSAVGSWRTQGSVAGSRWSAVKGSQAAPAPTSAASAAAPVPASPERSEPEPEPEPEIEIEPAPAAATVEPAVVRSVALTPAKARDLPRRTSGFGLRWGRNKPQHSAAPVSAPTSAPVSVPASAPVSVPASAPALTPASAPVSAPASAPSPESAASPVLVQPAVPFSVAPAAEQRAASDGMTPWRAAAARASKQSQQSQQSHQQSQQSQQQASVAETAPAEQEASA
jgi:ABC-type multidrug transport system ATPase subunit